MTDRRAADDFAAIAARMKEIRGEPPAPVEKPVCPKCEGGGWECFGLGYGDPHFRECTACYNPQGLLSP